MTPDFAMDSTAPYGRPAGSPLQSDVVFDTIAAAGLMPVIVIERAEDAVPLAEALIEGGLPVAEVTFRTEAAARAIGAMAKMPGLLLGAGTVLKPEQVDQAMDLGARFALAPGFDPKVAERARAKGFPFVPGVLTPTEIGAALDAGFSVQKFFPAEPAGGAAYLKAVSAPLRGVRFVPTGSIDLARLPSYLQMPNVLAVGGSWMVAPKLIQDRNWKEIIRLAREAVAAVRATRGS
jgi:2-dehydro-3-deoxyphosphogluconate aldolase/(4S)-4-hydroxy-2-oxoglutarate aldolase